MDGFQVQIAAQVEATTALQDGAGLQVLNGDVWVALGMGLSPGKPPTPRKVADRATESNLASKVACK